MIGLILIEECDFRFQIAPSVATGHCHCDPFAGKLVERSLKVDSSGDVI
jgi:hypothetical protein